MRWPVVGLLLAAACAQAHEPEATHVAEVTLDEWRAAGLPEPNASCSLERLSVRLPETMAAYLELCPPNSLACLRWRNEVLPSGPRAVISPAATDDMVTGLAVHELLHGAGRCADLWQDVYDYEHTDPRVWGAKGVEAVAERALEGG